MWPCLNIEKNYILFYNWIGEIWYLVEEVVALFLILSLSSFLEEGNWARISSDDKNEVREDALQSKTWNYKNTRSLTCDVELGGVELL